MCFASRTLFSGNYVVVLRILVLVVSISAPTTHDSNAKYLSKKHIFFEMK